MSSSSLPLCEREQSANGDAATDQVFFITLFNQGDYLLAKSEPGDGNEDDEEFFEEIRIDPRLLQEA